MVVKVDWFRVISDLERLGITIQSQAVESEVSPGTIYYWRNGGSPKHYNGELLLQLYMRVVGEEPPHVKPHAYTIPSSTGYLQSTLPSTGSW